MLCCGTNTRGTGTRDAAHFSLTAACAHQPPIRLDSSDPVSSICACAPVTHHSDEIFDLLCTIPRGRADRPVPQIKESRNDKIEVENIVKAEVKSAEETFE